jgi:hypothetical protein
MCRRIILWGEVVVDANYATRKLRMVLHSKDEVCAASASAQSPLSSGVNVTVKGGVVKPGSEPWKGVGNSERHSLPLQAGRPTLDPARMKRLPQERQKEKRE